MSRAVDGLAIDITCKRFNLLIFVLQRYGPIYLDFSPRRVVFSGWTGDADPTFEGLKVTLKKYLQSAWAGKCMAIYNIYKLHYACMDFIRVCEFWF